MSDAAEDEDDLAELVKLADSPLRPRTELFCQHIVEGMPQRWAYIEAGYSPNGADENAHRMITSAPVRKRIAELRAPAIKKVLLTQEEHLANLARLRDAACTGDTPAYGAAVSAEKARGQCVGLYVKRVEVTGQMTVTPAAVAREILAAEDEAAKPKA